MSSRRIKQAQLFPLAGRQRRALQSSEASQNAVRPEADAVQDPAFAGYKILGPLHDHTQFPQILMFQLPGPPGIENTAGRDHADPRYP